MCISRRPADFNKGYGVRKTFVKLTHARFGPKGSTYSSSCTMHWFLHSIRPTVLINGNNCLLDMRLLICLKWGCLPTILQAVFRKYTIAADRWRFWILRTKNEISWFISLACFTVPYLTATFRYSSRCLNWLISLFLLHSWCSDLWAWLLGCKRFITDRGDVVGACAQLLGLFAIYRVATGFDLEPLWPPLLENCVSVFHLISWFGHRAWYSSW